MAPVNPKSPFVGPFTRPVYPRSLGGLGGADLALVGLSALIPRLGATAEHHVLSPIPFRGPGEPGFDQRVHRRSVAAFEQTYGQQPHFWMETVRQLQVNPRFQREANNLFGSPVGKAAIGFQAGASIRYSLTAPYDSGTTRPAIDAVPPAITPEILGRLPQGSLMILEGQGNAKGSVEANLPIPAGGPFLGGDVGGKYSRRISGQFAIEAERLNDDPNSPVVHVRFGKRKQSASNVHAHLNYGVRAPIANAANGILDIFAGSRFASAPVLGNVAEAGRIFGNSTQLGISYDGSRLRSDEVLLKATLNLADPAHQQAFQSLMTLDVDPALALVRTGQTLNRNADQYENKADEARERNLQVKAGSNLLYGRRRQNVYNERTVVNAFGTKVGASSVLTDQMDGFFPRILGGGPREVVWRAETYDDGSGSGPDTAYRVSFRKARNAMNREEAEYPARFARLEGQVESEWYQPTDSWLADKLGREYGRADVSVDFLVHGEGMRRIIGLGKLPEAEIRARIYEVYGRASMALEGVSEPPPWIYEATSREQAANGAKGKGADTETAGYLMARYDDGFLWFNNDTYKHEYFERFGRDIDHDMKDWDAAERLVQFVVQNRSKPEKQWVRAFANAGERAKYGAWSWKELAAISLFAGRDNTYLDHLMIRGNRVEVAARDERAQTFLAAGDNFSGGLFSGGASRRAPAGRSGVAGPDGFDELAAAGFTGT